MKNSEYFELLQQGLKNAMEVAQAAKSLGLDPTTEVEIPLAVDLAERVEKLIGIPGIAVRVREMEKNGMSREEAALAIGVDFAEGRLGKGASKIESVENAIRTSVALLTEGVVAAPIEGIARVDRIPQSLLRRPDKIGRRNRPGSLRSRGRLCEKKRRDRSLESEA
jgi:DNA polymerase II large subunit